MNRMNIFILGLASFLLTSIAGCASVDLCGDEPRLACASRLIASDRFDAAYATLLPMANANSGEAQLAIAMIVANGHGEATAKGADVQTRQRAAYPWIEKAAKNGETHAISWLADGYKHGWFGLVVNTEMEQCLRQIVKQRIGSVERCRAR